MRSDRVGRRIGQATAPPRGATDEGHEPCPLAEMVFVPERLIVSPATGVFRPHRAAVVTGEGEVLRAGQVLGTVEGPGTAVEVVSAHTGFLMGLLAAGGERVRVNQPLAWVRSFE